MNRFGDEDGEVEVPQPPRLTLGGDEVLDVGVVAPHGRHHRAPAGASGHDGAAHRVPHVHEGQRSGGIGADAAHGRALRPERGEVVADPTPLLHGERGFAQVLENAAEIIGDVAHDEAVE